MRKPRTSFGDKLPRRYKKNVDSIHHYVSGITNHRVAQGKPYFSNPDIVDKIFTKVGYVLGWQIELAGATSQQLEDAAEALNNALNRPVAAHSNNILEERGKDDDEIAERPQQIYKCKTICRRGSVTPYALAIVKEKHYRGRTEDDDISIVALQGVLANAFDYHHRMHSFRPPSIERTPEEEISHVKTHLKAQLGLLDLPPFSLEHGMYKLNVPKHITDKEIADALRIDESEVRYPPPHKSDNPMRRDIWIRPEILRQAFGFPPLPGRFQE